MSSRAAFGSNYDRFVELKRRYDPTGMFEVNHSVVPDAEVPAGGA